MATRGTIAGRTRNNNDHVIKSIYVHFDAYGFLPILKEHYNTQEKVDQLLALGDLSALGESPECPEGHTYDTPVDGYCVAFGRDRDEENTEAEVFSNMEMFLIGIRKYWDRQYTYYWDGQDWEQV